MKLMIGESKNSSAGYCIDAIGFSYLNGALAAEGLYSRKSGGIWLGSNYQGRSWKQDPLLSSTQTATAEAVARFLTLLENERLVNASASQEMRDIMRLAGSWFEEGLSAAGRPVSDCYAKVGIFGTYHDCAVIERSHASVGRLRSAVVGLNAIDPDFIRSLSVELDNYLRATH